MEIPFLSFAREPEALKAAVAHALQAVHDSGWYVLGPQVRAFEEAYARHQGCAYSVGTGNGYDALVLALRACGIGPGDAVVVPAHTYVATWLAVTAVGAALVPVEPDPDTCLLDVRRLEAVITPATKAILPVHLYGQACDMTTVMTIARRHGLKVVEDNAQAHGARWQGRMTGTFGDVNATSFYPTKNLGALGDGGAITTNDAAAAAQVACWRNYGMAEKNRCVARGINSRLDELQAAVLVAKLEHLDNANAQRRALAAHYREGLAGVGDVVLPQVRVEAEAVYHLMVVRTAQRDALRTYLAQRGVHTMVHYPVPPHLQEAYADLGYRRGDFPLTEQLADTVLSLPLWPGMTADEVAYVCRQVRDFFG